MYLLNPGAGIHRLVVHPTVTGRPGGGVVGNVVLAIFRDVVDDVHITLVVTRRSLRLVQWDRNVDENFVPHTLYLVGIVCQTWKLASKYK
jgi:hypothetical protein